MSEIRLIEAPMGVVTPMRRRRSDKEGFIETVQDPPDYVEQIFSELKGPVVLDFYGTPCRVTLFDDRSPDKRVALHACLLAIALAKQVPLRVKIKSIVLAAILHDLGKFHADSVTIIRSATGRNLRKSTRPKDIRLLELIREIHTKKGPSMLDRLTRAKPWLAEHRPYLDMVTTYHDQPYVINAAKGEARRFAFEINLVTLCDDHDALMSDGPERDYKDEEDRCHTVETAAYEHKRRTQQEGRYATVITDTFIDQVLGARIGKC